MKPTGAYNAERASALSGVPRSTIHYWSRADVLTPSVSAERVKLWSHADLVALRIIYWLRQHKTDAAGAEIPATGMKSIRRALRRLRSLDEPLLHLDEAALWVDADGEIHLRGPGGPEALERQIVLPDAINVVAPFTTREGLLGPDLARPREQLRIAPGRVSGSPHVLNTRLETRARDGLDPTMIQSLYPYVTREQIQQAIDLELQLEKNLAIRVAA